MIIDGAESTIAASYITFARSDCTESFNVNTVRRASANSSVVNTTLRALAPDQMPVAARTAVETVATVFSTRLLTETRCVRAPGSGGTRMSVQRRRGLRIGFSVSTRPRVPAVQARAGALRPASRGG